MTVRSRRAGAAAVCLLLAVAHTWPLALHPARNSRNDNADTQLNEWILAWVAHQLPRDPVHLFEANIFYPAHDSLAFSEPLIVPALMGAPLAWAGASPVLVYNVVLILGFALTAFATALVIDAWTGDLLAGLAAGSLFAFNTHTLTRLSHVQGIHIYGLPLALLATDRLIRGGSLRHALLLAFWIVVMTYTSGYLFVFAVVMVAIALATSVREWRRRAAAVGARLALAAAAAAVAIVPLAIPYGRVAREQHMLRSLDVIKQYSATPRGYIASAGRLHFDLWSHVFFKDPIDSFFPGITILALALAAIVLACRRRHAIESMRSRVIVLVGIAATGFVLSLGTATPIYGWLFRLFPPMQGLRAAARFGNLFLLGVALLGGLGLAAWKRPAWVALGAVVLINVESLRAPFDYRRFTGIPALYDLVAAERGPVVLAEQPFYPAWAVFENAPYVLNSTAHWRPLMNGYSGYMPDSYEHYAEAFRKFPEERAIKAMKDAGVTHVVVHPQAFLRDAENVVRQAEARSDLELMAIGPDGIRLYRLEK